MNRLVFSRRYSELVSKIKDSSRSGSIALFESRPACDISITYGELYALSTQLALRLENMNNVSTVAAYFHPSCNIGYAVSMIGTWMSGKRFVPLCTAHPLNEISYYLSDSTANVILHDTGGSINVDGGNTLSQINLPKIDVNEILKHRSNLSINKKFTGESESTRDRIATEDALILYTSGTTGRPKGVLHTHTGLKHMMTGLTSAWQYTASDHILHFLPLHHLHGVLNKLLCMLWAGGSIEFLPSASPHTLWTRLAAQHVSDNARLAKHLEASVAAQWANRKVTMFMAVPTVYAKLLESAKSLPTADLQRALATVQGMRVMACGSAALPDVLLHSWQALTGQQLLERYGMTELGMVLSNPLLVSRRRGGHVGDCLPGVKCRLVDEQEQEIVDCGVAGELRVKGPCVFKEYINRPKEVTSDCFDKDGWFRTGDIALRSLDDFKSVAENGNTKEASYSYQLLGRSSVDIIKSGGYKISALEIEREMLSHPQVLEAAVLGLLDPVLGQLIVAIITIRKNSELDEESEICLLKGGHAEVGASGTAAAPMKLFLQSKIAPYKIPKIVHIVESIPRNALGKVNKRTLMVDVNVV